MREKAKNNQLTLYLSVFIALNIFLYLFISLFHQRVPFHRIHYLYNTHHFLTDPRIEGKGFHFLRALGQYDSQWYLKIAADGYPKNPKIADLTSKTMDGLLYNFLPLYPMLIYMGTFLFKDIELSAFAIANVLLILNFLSLYFVLSRLFSKQIALKAIFLLFFWPFAIFYRSYYTVGLFLFLLIWFSYFLIKGKLLFSGIFLSLLNITWGMGIFLNFFFLYKLLLALFEKKLSIPKAILIGMLVAAPYVAWIGFNYHQTANPMYFYRMRQKWFDSPSPLKTIDYNISKIFQFPHLPVHNLHSSKIDALMILAVTVLLVKSRKKLPFDLWIISAAIGFTSLLIQDTISYSRFQIVSFPLFVYLASVLKGRGFLITFTLFLIVFFITSLYFVNWHWIG